MNLLIDTAPDYIVVRGKKIKINTSFGVWVKFIVASKKDDAAMAQSALDEIFGKMPTESPQEVMSQCLKWLYTETNKSNGNNSQSNGNSSVPFDFDVDGNVIYCELWEYFPHLMERGISYHEGMELIKLLMHNDDTMLWHRAFARCGDFSKMDKEQKKYWQKQRAIWVIPNTDQQSIDDVFATAF